MCLHQGSSVHGQDLRHTRTKVDFFNYTMSCIPRLGLYREAEKQFKSALKQQGMVDSFLYLAKVMFLTKVVYIAYPSVSFPFLLHALCI